MAEATGVKNLGFDRIASGFGRRESLWLRGSQAAYGYTDKQKHLVIPIIQTSRTLYWLSASLDLVFDSGDYIVQAISISVFRGDYRDETKTAIFRAEWASYPDTGGDRHAQPHWHIYPDRDRSMESQREITSSFLEDQLAEFSAVEGSEELEGQEWTGAHKFHYAMASQWHEEEGRTHSIKFDAEEQVLKWMKRCVRYVIEQIKYVDS